MRIPPPPAHTQNETADVLPPVLLRASELGAMVWRQNSGLFRALRSERRVRSTTNGCADILGLISLSVPRLHELGIPRIGAFLSIETKTATGTLEPSQREFRAGVESRGGLYFIAREPGHVDLYLGRYL